MLDLRDKLREMQKAQIEAVAADMWPAFTNSIETNTPKAEIVHDRFHISKHLNEAVDKVRRQENKVLAKADDDRLKGTKQLWLFNPENMIGVNFGNTTVPRVSRTSFLVNMGGWEWSFLEFFFASIC